MVRTKLRAVRVCAGLLTCGAVGLYVYSTHKTALSAEAACQGLRTSILSTLEQNVDPSVKRARVHKDLTEFERSCALRDPDAKAVYSAVDRTILFTGTSDAERASSRPVRFVPPPPGLGHRWPGLLPPPDAFRARPFRT